MGFFRHPDWLKAVINCFFSLVVNAQEPHKKQKETSITIERNGKSIAEPDASLFQVPSDYKLIELPRRGVNEGVVVR